MRKTLAATFGFAMTVGLVTLAPQATADTEVTLYPGDVQFCDSADYATPAVCAPNEHNSHKVNRASVRLTAVDYSGYTSGKFALPDGTTLSDVTDASMQWFNKPGSNGEPGIRVQGDFDGDGTTDTLWGESIYGDDWWLNGNSSQAVKDAAPSTEGGSGSGWHGTLDQWAAAFPDGAVTTGGYTLGVPADGLLRSLTYAGTTYRFTKDAEPLPVARPKVKWAQNINVTKRFAKFTVEARQPKGTQSTKRGAYYRVQVVNPRTDRVRRAGHGRVTADNSDRIKINPSAYLPRAKKALRVQVISYGDRRSNIVFHPTNRSRNHAKADASRKGWD